LSDAFVLLLLLLLLRQLPAPSGFRIFAYF
jgi:hypothetical protein